MTPPKKKSGTRPVATRSGTRPATPRTGANRPTPGKPAGAGNASDAGGPAGGTGKPADADRSGGAGSAGVAGGAGESGAGVAEGAGTGGARETGGVGEASSGGGAGKGGDGAGVGNAAQNGTAAKASRSAGSVKTGKTGDTKTGDTKAGSTKAGNTKRDLARTRPAVPTPALVVGTIPALARVAGIGALAAALLLLIQPAFPLVREGGHGLGGAHNLWDFVVPLPAALLVAAAGALCLLGRLPRLGLAVLIAAGGYGLGALFRAAALLDTGSHSSIDLPLPEGVVRAFRYTPGPGLVLQVAALGLLAAVLVLALLAWRRTVMDDDGSFDPLRPTFAGMGFAGGLIGFAAVAFPPASPLPGSLTVAMPSVFERSGLDLLGGWLLIVAVLTVAVGAATVRPRLAVVGMFAGLAAMFGTAALGNLLLVVRSTALDLDTGAAFQVAAAAVFAALAVAAWRVRWRPADPSGDGA